MISDIFLPAAKTGRPQRDRRTIVAGILWILRTGSQWRDFADEFGPRETYYGCFDRWNDNGIWDKLLDRLRAARVDIGKFNEDW